MVSRQRLFSNLKCSEANVKLGLSVKFSRECFLISLRFAIKRALMKFLRCGSILIWVSLLCYLGCAVPEQDGTGVLRTPKPPNVDLVPSIRTREAPPILGVNYVKTIGRAGQGAGEFLMPMGLVIDAYQPAIRGGCWQ